MRVVVDSHALYFYIFSPERLSDPALEALGESEDSAITEAGVVEVIW